MARSSETRRYRALSAWIGRVSTRPEPGWWRSARRLWHDYQWFVLGALSVVAAALGCAGFYRLAVSTGGSTRPLDLAYATLQLFLIDSGSVAGPLGWQLEVARWLAPAVTAYAAVQALAALFAEQIQSARLRSARDHVVICGASRKGVLLATGFAAAGEQVVIMEADEDNDLLDQCRSRGVTVLVGDATDTALLKKAGVHHAKCLIAVCGDDAQNAEIAMRARELTAGPRRQSLRCIIHLVDPRLCDLLKERELELEAGTRFRLELFNVYERGGRLLLHEVPVLESTTPGQPPHLLIVGLGWLGSSLAVHAAKSWRDRGEQRRLRISVLDRAAEWKCEALELRYPQLSSVCELVPHQLDIRSAEFERAEFLLNEMGGCDVDAIYVCIDDDAFGLHVGLALLARTRRAQVPVVVRMATGAGLATLLRGNGDDGFRSLHAFGLLDRTCSPELVLGGTHEILARAMHDDYCSQQRLQGATPDTRPYLVPWEVLPEWKRESNREVVDHIAARLRTVGYGIAPLANWDADAFRFQADELEALARLEHERWCAELHQQGWRYAVGDRNEEGRTHPWLVAWVDLPPEVREDNIQRVVRLPAFLAQAGFELYRRG